VTNLSLKVEKEAEAAGFHHNTPEAYKFDPETYLWEGWMLVGELPDSVDAYIPANEEFIHVDADGLKRSTDVENGSPLEDKVSPGLKPLCEGGPCIPSAYLEVLKNGPAPGFRFMQTEGKLKAGQDYDGAKKQIDEMTARIGDENDCRVQEWIEDDKVIARNFCKIIGDDAMINAFDGNLREIMSKLASVIPPEDVPTPPDGTEYTIEFFKQGDAASEIKTIAL